MYHNQMNPDANQHPSMMNLQQQHMSSAGLDVLELMALQERAGQSSVGAQNGQPTTPQMLLEQQVRLNQLQQLQQLQNQIFQQQVRLIILVLCGVQDDGGEGVISEDYCREL